MKRSGIKRGRKPIKPRSDAVTDDLDRRAAVKAAVLARDGRRCVLYSRQGTLAIEIVMGVRIERLIPWCGGVLDFGHRRHAGAGGAYVEQNGNTLCRRHNGWAEDEPDAARAVDTERPDWLVVREGDPEWTELGRKAQGVR